MNRMILLSVLALLTLSGMVFAGCAADAYAKACSGCSFDANGKIDQSCSEGYQNSGTACVSTSYPIMSAQYAQGKCPQVDSCAAELRSCQAQYETGNDKNDCQEGSLGVCYAAADECVKQAAVKCGEIEKQCPGSSAVILLPFLGLGYLRFCKGPKA